MQHLRIALRIAIFAIVFIGISQAFISYAVVPDKYIQESYGSEEVKKIAYNERSAGLDFVYANSYTNGMTFALLGMLIASEMWASSKIELFKVTNHQVPKRQNDA